MRRWSLLGLTAIMAVLIGGVALAPQQPTAAQTAPPMDAPFKTPAGDLRMQMDQLMSEHTAMAGVVTQKAATNAPDFQAAQAALDKNSVAIADMIGQLYGPDAQAQFLPLWRAHIQGYLDYTAAAGANDAARKDQVRADLDNWVRTMTDTFAALNPTAPRDDIANQLNTHVTGTLTAIDTFAAQDFPRHYDVVHDAFMHSFMMGDVFAASIVQQFPDRYAQ